MANRSKVATARWEDFVPTEYTVRPYMDMSGSKGRKGKWKYISL